ncbi:hypothetical protein EJB05_22019, partial [Eragrostis curvula]
MEQRMVPSMRKCMCKEKASCEATSMEVTPFRVCTRARTIMLQKKHTQEGEDADREYLELRNRKVERVYPRKLAPRRDGRMKTVVKEGTKASFKENMLELVNIAR